MDLYEELGVARSASTEEIRQAYRTLVRLVHPDQCTDEKVRALAEIQMKRLNQILAILLDPQSRRDYDATLRAPVAIALSPSARTPVSRVTSMSPAVWVWCITAGLGVCGIASYFAYNRIDERRQPPPASAKIARRTSHVAKPLDAKPRPVEMPEAHDAGQYAQDLRQEMQPEVTVGSVTPRFHPPTLSVAPGNAPIEPPPPAIVKSELHPFLNAPVLTSVAPPVVNQADGRFIGNWFYVHSTPQPTTSRLYPPEYIELRLSREGGTLWGRYRARYLITDQAISPVVSFEFQGPAVEPSAKLLWAGAGNSKGEVRLKLLSPTTLEVNWKAYRLSDDLNLAAGTAILIRESRAE